MFFLELPNFVCIIASLEFPKGSWRKYIREEQNKELKLTENAMRRTRALRGKMLNTVGLLRGTAERAKLNGSIPEQPFSIRLSLRSFRCIHFFTPSDNVTATYWKVACPPLAVYRRLT